MSAADTVLLRLTPDGSPTWMRAVQGAGAQRGKSLAVAPDGSVAFGGDTVGALVLSGTPVATPPTGGGRDAWLSRWSPTGALQWATTWGGPGDDLAKGVVDDGQSVTSVGPFKGTITLGAITLGATTLDAGTANDLVLVQRSAAGVVRWATSVSAPTAVLGAEMIAASDGGLLFGSTAVAGLRFGSTGGGSIALNASDGATAWLAHYRPDGSPDFARTIAGTVFGNTGKIARVGHRVYVDITLRGPGNTVNGTPLTVVEKDGSVWALDLAPTVP
ncbi:MAG: hypothetical protein ABIP21_06730 [Acidimicrobiia bacterium]